MVNGISLSRLNVSLKCELGGRIGMLGGYITNFFHDLQVVRPTILYGVPRIWAMIRDEFLNDLKLEYLKLLLQTYSTMTS